MPRSEPSKTVWVIYADERRLIETANRDRVTVRRYVLRVLLILWREPMTVLA
jgi:hypothetical protein